MGNTYKKTIVLGLDYSDFSGGITECNRKMGVLTAEFNRASEEAKVYGTETDQLRIKHDFLTQKIELQKKIVSEAAKSYDKATSANKNNEKAVDAADKALLQQRTSLLKLEGQLKETEKAMGAAEKKNDSFGESIRKTADFFGIEMNPALESFASKFDGVNKQLFEGAALIGGITGIYANLSLELSRTADNLLTLSSTSGLSTDTLQELQYASEFVDVSVETMNGSMAKMIRTMSDARDGNKDLQKEFARLGVRYKETDGTLRDAETTFYDLIDALGNVNNETERDSMAMDIFGRSARDLNPLIEAGSKRLRELGNQAHEAGYVLSNDLLQSAGELDDEMQEMNRKVEAVKLQLGIALLPILTKLVDIIGSIPTPVLVASAVFGTLIITFGFVTKAIISFRNQSLLAAAASAALGAGGGTAAAGLAPLLIVLLAVAAAIALIVGGVSAVKESMSEVKTVGNEIVNAAQKSGQSKPKYNAKGTEYYSGGETWVGEEGPELVELPRGSRIYSNRDSSRMKGSGNTYIFNIQSENVKEFNRLVEMAEREQMAYRTGVARI